MTLSLISGPHDSNANVPATFSSISDLPEVERHRILVEWNRTERDYPQDKCLHQLFEEQVERTPDVVSVVFEGQSLTYRELNTCAYRSVRHVFCSSEALPYDLQEKFFYLLDAQLYNLYGATEAAVDATHWTCRPDSELRIVPIGRPVANTQCYILDTRFQPSHLDSCYWSRYL